MTNFANLDLNLLRVFDALFEERSVTRAGSRLHVTQSAVSHALARLRDILDDELFIKSPDGMTPTVKARAVGPRLRAGLLQLQAALMVDAFNPATAEHHYTIAADAYACAVLLPSVVGRIRADAPGVGGSISPFRGMAGCPSAWACASCCATGWSGCCAPTTRWPGRR